MERVALYRRALAPTTLALGGVGTVAAAVGWGLDLSEPRSFGLFWMAVAGVALVVAVLLMRRQALRDREAFWSPPARRVLQAVLPAFVVGLVAGIVTVFPIWQEPLWIWWLPAVWTILYGCALHAAGFFMPRGIRLFGWLFVLSGCALVVVLHARSYASGMPDLVQAHVLMGGLFGGFHLAYGLYLLKTREKSAAPDS
jgi:hypothetical protein